MKAEFQGVYTDLLSWGTMDAKQGCVSLRLSATGNLEYGEMPAKDSGSEQAWKFIFAEPALKLDDGGWHHITIARSEFGIVYMYSDAVPVGQDIMPGPLPSKGLPHAETAMTCPYEPGYPRPFRGVIGGFRLYDVALSAPQVMAIYTSHSK